MNDPSITSIYVQDLLQDPTFIDDLQVNVHITTIIVGHWHAAPTATMMALSKILLVNSTITSIVFEEHSQFYRDYNGKYTDAIIAIAHALRINTTLTYIRLPAKPITPIGLNALSDALKTNTAVKTIFLAYTKCFNLATATWASTLIINSTITNINLSYCWINQNGANAISSMLKINTTLATMNLTGNFIEDRAMVTLSNGLLMNSAITWIDCSQNKCTECGFTALIKAFNSNEVIRFLYMYCDFHFGAEINIQRKVPCYYLSPKQTRETCPIPIVSSMESYMCV